MSRKKEVLSLLEFICNLRWVFSYAAEKLDPVVEAHYAHIIEDVKVAESLVSRSYASVGSLLELPSEALALTRKGIVYLLVAEGVLGHCPPTMHSFLLRATAPVSSVLSTECTTSSNGSTVTQLYGERSEYQAHFLSFRWLIAEGLLTDEELVDAMGDGMEASAQGQRSRFDLHVLMARAMTVGTHFALGAHIAITRSLLLHYCCTLLSVEDIITHVRFLDPTCHRELQSMEEALLFWIFHVLKAMYEKNILDKCLYDAAMDDLGKSLYGSLQSGVLIGLTIHFYQPKMLPLRNITINCSGPIPREQARQYAFHNWGVVLRIAEELGLSPGLFADEVEEYGAVVLQLHALRFVQELFALLATQAEGLFEAGVCDTVPSFTLSAISQPVHSEESIDVYSSIPKEKGDVRSGRHVIINSSCEKVNKMTESYYNCSDDGGNSNKSQKSVPHSGNFPSAHSRRQYDVMMTSLHLRGLSARVTPVKINGSPLRSRTSATESLFPTNSSTSGSFPLHILPQHNIVENLNIKETSRKNNVTESVDKPRKEPAKGMRVQNNILLTSDQLDSSRTPSCNADGGNITFTVVRSSECSSTVSFVERAKSVSNRYSSASDPREVNLNTFCNNPIVGVNPTCGVKIETPCTTSESSFPVNSIWRPGTSLLSRDERVEPISVIPSHRHSLVLGELDTDSQGISPLTPDIVTNQSVMMGEPNLCASFGQLSISLKNERQHPLSRPLFDSNFVKKEIMHDTSMFDPSLVAINGDRGALLQALGKQRALILHLTRKLKETGMNGYCFHSLEKFLAEEGNFDAGDTLKSAHMSALSSVDTQTVDSGQLAETDISSTFCDFFEGEGSYLDC